MLIYGPSCESKNIRLENRPDSLITPGLRCPAYIALATEEAVGGRIGRQSDRQKKVEASSVFSS